MPDNHPAPVHRYVFVAVLALAAALAFVILIAVIRFYFLGMTERSEQATSTQDKMQILEQLGAGSGMTEDEKQAIVDEIPGNESEVSAQQKLQILNQLNSR